MPDFPPSGEASAARPFSATRAVAAKFAKPDVYGAINMPVYRNAAFEFESAKAIAAAFQYRRDLHTYSRISNPTVAHFEDKVRAASGAENVVALASGMAAISHTFLTLAWAGANIVSSPRLFGNTFSFFKSTLAAFGVETRFVNADDPAQVEAAIDENTCAFFTEVVTNPHLEVPDLPRLSPILRRRGVPMVVDTTVIPWCGFDAKKAGVDIEVVSTTKYVSGGATSLGGVVVDYGTFDWRAHRRLGQVPRQRGLSPFAFKLRGEIAQNVGATMSPDSAYLQSLGVETLPVRYARMSSTAHALARRFSAHPRVLRANYPALESSPYKAVSDRLFTGDPGAMFTLSLADEAACFAFLDALAVIRRATNLFDHKTLAIHPSSTIYCHFSPETKAVMGIEDNLVRFSAGLEDPEDLAADIERALERAAPARP